MYQPVMSINSDVHLLSDDNLSQREDRAKVAGHSIYNSIHGADNSRLPPPRAAATHVTLPPGDDMNTNIAEDPMLEGKMSSVRRTFILFVLFDLILMFILWVIYTQLIGDSGYRAFERRVQQYTFRTSLFDAVMLSAVRFTFLLLGYGLFRLRHWWVVAITTALSCAVLIAKIFIFDFEGAKSTNNPLSYCVIIISFVLAWLETWFLDFKVLPHEKKLLLRISQTYTAGYGTTHSRLGPHVRVPDDMRSLITEDNQFYSPMDSPAGSDVEEGGRDDHDGNDYHSVRSSRTHTRQENDYVRLARHSWDVLWTYINSPESNWKTESGTDVDTGIVHSMKVKGVGKVFRLQGKAHMPAKDLFEEITHKPEIQPQWNASIKESKVLQVVDHSTDILYNVAAEIAGGIITSRDFVTLRTWGEREEFFIGAGMGVNHPDKPPQKAYIRGTNGVGGFVYKPWTDEADKCLFMWFMNTDIKGWFPQKLIDANMAKVQLEFFRDLTVHVNELTSQGS